ncbi:MAG: response regulator transcription factor [Bacteroidota bacterium]
MAAEKILIVEDEPAIAVDIAINLEGLGYDIVDVVHSGEEGQTVIANQNVDLVMLDINLGGGMSGIDLARILDQEYGIPFIFLTSYADDDTINQAADTYPASYLVKPYKEQDLAPAVKVALMRKNGTKKSRLPPLNKINRGLLSPITTSEYAIINELWNGSTNGDIASKLFLSINTIKTHNRNIYSKLDVHSKPELLKYLRELK